MIHVDATVLGDPIPKGRPRHGRNGHTYTPARTEAAEKAMAWELRQSRTSRRLVTTPVAVILTFRCKTRRRCDIDNLAKLVLDAGNGVVWVDDQQVERLVVRVQRGVDRPCTHILITEA